MSKKSFSLICSLCVFCGSGFAQTLTQISDTLYNADGTKASGRIVISWDPFTTASNVTVDGGTKTYTIPATGASAGGVDVSLYPNAGATPAGTSYRVRYYLANGASYPETWVVPATGPVTIAGVRASVVPSLTITFNPTTQLYNASIAKGTLLAGSGTAGYLGLLGIGANGLCLVADSAQSLGMKWGSCAAGGSGISSLNGQTGSSQTFANDTNVTISSAGNIHTLGWAGTLAATRLNGNVVQAASNDTNVTGSIASQTLTLGWTGTLGLARGGTNQSAWTAARCVRVNTGGTALESASADCGAGGGGNHNLLSATHPDTTAGTVARGDLVVGQGATATWQRLALGTSGRYLRSDGTDAAWSTIVAGDLPSTVVRTDQTNAYSGTTTQDFGASTTTLVAPKKTDPGSPATGELWINSGALKYRDNQGTPATQTAEIQSNKNAASGYAGLTASIKLNASQGQEVWALADLSDVAAATGSGTTVVLQTSPTLAGTPVIGDGAGNDKLSFTAELSNPACAAGNYFVWANSTDLKLKKCENATISDLGAGGGGDNISVNGTAATDANFSDSTPAASAGTSNVLWQKDAATPNNLSANIDWGKVMDAIRRKPFYYTDFLGPSGAATGEAILPWDYAIVAGGTASKTAGTANHPGVLTLSSSTTANSGGSVLMENNINPPAPFLLGGGETTEFIFQLRNLATAGTTWRMGFVDTLNSADATDGAYIEITSTTGNAVLKTATGGTRTTSATIASLATDTWYRARISVNAAATSVVGEIFNDSGTSLGSQTNTTNIPTVAGNETGHGVIATNSGTAVTLLFYIDWMAMWFDTRALTR